MSGDRGTPCGEAPTATPHPVFTHREIMRVMFGVMICILLAALDQTAVIPAIPAIARDLHARADLSWIVAAYLITATICKSLNDAPASVCTSTTIQNLEKNLK